MGDEEAARAFVPGHVSGFFSVHPDEDPARAGARGAGPTLTDGVHVTVTPAGETAVRLDGDPADIAAVEGVLDALDLTARVTVEPEVPVGAGFGVSGGAALGTALAANELVDGGRSEDDLVRLAHVAEVEAGTGMGDVAAQARGGVPVTLEPGAPPHGRLDGIPARGRVEYLSLGGLSTAAVLGGDTEGLSDAGERALGRLLDRPTLPRLFAASRGFASAAGLLTDEVAAILEDVADADGMASMAMLGESVFAIGTGLSDAGYDPAVCEIHPAGARLE